MEYRRDGLLTAFGRAMVVALETIVGGRDKTGMSSATVAREKARTELQTSQKELKSSVNARQEAGLVLVGVID